MIQCDHGFRLEGWGMAEYIVEVKNKERMGGRGRKEG